MNDSNTVKDHDIGKSSFRRSTYLTIDGIVKYCVTAPLLELPIDFKEWYKPAPGNANQPQAQA
jgi:hypothetical protein